MNIYDFIIIFIICTSTVIGLIRGFLREVLSFFILYFVFFFFSYFHKEIKSHFSFISNIFLQYMTIFFVMGIIVLCLESIFLYFFYDFFIEMRFLGLNNFVLGFLFGLLRGIFLVFYCIIFLNKILHINNYFYYKNSFFIPIFLKFLYSIKNIHFF